MKRYELHTGDNREVLKTFADNSIDSIVTDPPYELGFMGKKWDASGIAYDVNLWKECLRVLKPGGHLLAFGGTRTYHRMTVAIEDAGFEIRESIVWVYSTGFPKSHNVSKAIDKQAGAEREVVATVKKTPSASANCNEGWVRPWAEGKTTMDITIPATDAAREWYGWGTALKPAHETIVMARKPLHGTVADNVLTWGVGALNIDGCRIASDDGFEKAWNKPVRTNISNGGAAFNTGKSSVNGTHVVDISANKPIGGRWPSNTLLDEEAAALLDAQSGGASRFFYVAKASKAEREAGLDSPDGERANRHPTIKPIALMRYLVRMVTPRGGVVLDPFMGSGTTGCAAMMEAVRFIGIELNEEYSGIAERRIRYWMSQNMMGI